MARRSLGRVSTRLWQTDSDLLSGGGGRSGGRHVLLGSFCSLALVDLRFGSRRQLLLDRRAYCSRAALVVRRRLWVCTKPALVLGKVFVERDLEFGFLQSIGADATSPYQHYERYKDIGSKPNELCARAGDALPVVRDTDEGIVAMRQYVAIASAKSMRQRCDAIASWHIRSIALHSCDSLSCEENESQREQRMCTYFFRPTVSANPRRSVLRCPRKKLLVELDIMSVSYGVNLCLCGRCDNFVVKNDGSTNKCGRDSARY